MTRNECMAILKDKDLPQYKELHHIYYTNKSVCRKYYDSLGYKGYTLHHKNVGCTNYEEWKIDEIEPMTRSEHSKLHMVYYKQGLGSEEAIKKRKEALRKLAASGKRHAWNKGLTKETDNRIKTSPRKGKIGKEFSFLCASKKGKSGGWNKNISKDDPRYASLKKSPEQCEKASKFMKENNPMFNSEYKTKQLQAVRSPEVQQSRREKITGRKKYTNGVEIHMFKPGEEPSGYILFRDYCKNQEIINEIEN